MSGIFKLFGMSILSVGACLLADVADAATGRANYANVRPTTLGANAARMPSMPTMPIMSTVNIAKDVLPANNPDGDNNPGGGNNDNPNNPDDPKDDLTTNCPDGGVENSEYTIDDCMRDVLACVNNGALPNGLNDMFNADLRASIINGMGLCYNQVDKCISEIRRNCKRVYGTRADVWIDFNSRKVQPEYYSFVLRNTGLTPTQAENTCLLLDRNTYGKSFAAVNNSDKVTSEYDEKIGAYNEQEGGSLSKDDPMGPNVNTNGKVDGQRGHYARWDAVNAECLIRVAAYNKDKQITNSWLFGTIGDEQPAEVWRVAGDTFTCNKDLFGFSLKKDTATVALLGVGGGTVLGAGVGAAVGAGIANKYAEICSNKQYRENLLTKIKESDVMTQLSEFLTYDITRTTKEINKELCEEIVSLQDVYEKYNVKITQCYNYKNVGSLAELNGFVIGCEEDEPLEQCLAAFITEYYNNSALSTFATGQGISKDDAVASAAAALSKCFDEDPNVPDDYIVNTDKCSLAEEIMQAAGFKWLVAGPCKFKPINKAKFDLNRSVTCSVKGNSMCEDYTDTKKDLDALKNVIDSIEVKQFVNRGATVGKGAGIGAAIGAGAGGLATAITALVEHDNISCRVGDGLGQVGLNKSYSIDSLKDLYVKWNLNLPDTQVMGATGAVTDEESWKDVCDDYSVQSKCENAQFYYRNKSDVLEWIYSACTWDEATRTCNPNKILLKSYGVVE